MGAQLPSAEIYARAIIAAAISFGDDPVKSLSGPRGVARRALAPAAVAIAVAGEILIDDVVGPLKVSLDTVRQARARGTESYRRAEREALEACRHAGLKPVRRAAPPVAPVAAEPPPPPADSAKAVAPPPAVHAPRVSVIQAPPADPDIKARAARLAELRREQAARPERVASGPVHRPAREVELVRRPNVRPSEPIVGDLQARILAELEGGDAVTSQGLATRLDVKESAVIASLSHLEAHHKVVSMPAPESATRRFVWKVTPIEATAHG